MAARQEDGGADERARRCQVWLLFCMRLCLHANRMVWAPLAVFVGKDQRYHLPPSERGKLLSAFPLGYLTTQILAGALADRHGGAPVVGTALLVGGLSMLLSPAAGGAMGLQGIAAITFAMGCASGGAMPASGSILAAWVPQHELGRASNIGDAGGTTGLLLATLLGPTLAAAGGWPCACFAFGTATLAFWVLWAFLAASHPPEPFEAEVAVRELLGRLKSPEPTRALREEAEAEGQRRRPGDGAARPGLGHGPGHGAGAGAGGGPGTRQDVDGDGQGGAVAGPPEPAPWLPPAAVLLHPPVWAVVLQHLFWSGHWFFYSGWMPTFFDEVLGIPPDRSSLYLSATEVSGLAAPCLVDALERLLRRRGWGLLDGRRLFACAGFAGGALATLHFLYLSHGARFQGGQVGILTTTMVWLSLNPIFNTMHAYGYKANYMDLTQDYSGLLQGFGNTCATVGNYLMFLGVGSLLHGTTGNWAPAFQCIFVLDICALLVALSAMSVERVDPWLVRVRQGKA